MYDKVDDEMWVLSDGWWAVQGYDILAEPFIKPDSDLLIYKNYYRDGSGRYDGYAITRKSEKSYLYIARTIGNMRSINAAPFTWKG
jgi:hypothetical protein